MATSMAEIIKESMIYIDDIRLQEQLEINPALFYRRVSAYVSAAMPLLSRPPELLLYLKAGYAAPDYDTYEWESTDESTTQATTIETGLTGYDLCSVTLRSTDGTYYTAYADAEYDSATGDLTFPVQTSSGLIYQINFYSDGEVATLTPSLLRLFALAVAIVWDERLDHNWLNMQPKIKDISFSTINESNYMDKLSSRKLTNRQMFQDDLRAYEQLYSYVNGTKDRALWKLV